VVISPLVAARGRSKQVLSFLNGAAGLSEVLAQALSQGVSGLSLVRKLLAGAETPASIEAKSDD